MLRRKFATITIISLILVFFLFLPQTVFSSQSQRIALVIGNGNYTLNPLYNPVNDANDMAAALRKCNFSVIKITNATRQEMRKSIRRFGEAIAASDAIGLFYYSGHAIQVDGENYMVPLGTGVYREDEVEDECLKVSSVLRKMISARNRLNIIVLDACRHNPFEGSFRSSTRGLAKMDTPIGSILAFSTAPGAVAADGTGRNGLYTSMLLKHILTPNLEIGQLFRRVRIDVMAASDDKQIPWESSSLTGNFYFKVSRGISVLDRPLPPGSGNIGNFETFVDDRLAGKQKWKNWQEKMDAAFEKAQQVDKSSEPTSREKEKVWADFLLSYKADNPFGQADNGLRQIAQKRLRHWADTRKVPGKKPAAVPRSKSETTREKKRIIPLPTL